MARPNLAEKDILNPSEAIDYLIVILEIVTITVLDIKDAKINIDFNGNI